MARKCKNAGSYRVCKFYDRENESNSIVVRRPATFSTEGEAYQFWFKDPKSAKRWYKELRGRTDVEDLLRNATGGRIEMQELKH